LLGLAPLLLIGFRSLSAPRRATLEGAAVLAMLCWLVWVVGNQRSGYLIQSRMYFSLFPALAVLAAAGFRRLDTLQPGPGGPSGLGTVRFGRIAAALVLLVLALNTLQIGASTAQKGALRAVLGQVSEAEYLDTNLGWYAPAVRAARDLPPGSRTLLLFESRGYYCFPACRPDEILDRWKRDFLAYNGDFASIAAAWKSEGFTHLLLSRSGLEFFGEHPDIHHPPEEIAPVDAFLAQLPPPENFGGAYELYRLP
jgi:hypothetical protein